MTLLLSVVAILLSVLAIFAYQWVTLLPQLGIQTLCHLRTVRIVVAVMALSMAAIAYYLNPSTGQLWVLLITIVLTPLSGANQASRFLVSLDAPQHVAASKATLGEQAEIIGIEIDDVACAWPLELLVPHHIANDHVGDTAVVACW